MKKFFYTILFLAIIIVLVLGYLGFVPGLSSIFGSDKPKDLGIVAGEQDLASVQAKVNTQYATITSADPSTSYALSGSKQLDTTFTDKELTALMAQHEKMWKYYPISSAQVRFNADGTAELSGILRTDRIYGYAAATGIPAEQVKSWLDKVKILVANPPIYLKGRVEVNNGVMSGELSELQIGRLSIPSNLYDGRQSELLSFAQNRLDKAGVNIETVNFQVGQANFKGMVPAVVGFSE